MKALWVPLAVLALALLWHQVFAMTGLLWWDAPGATAKLPRPAAPHLTPAPTDWVEVDTYLRTHPVWQP